MRHKDDCDCANCETKGTPILEIHLANATANELVKVTIYDWLEGYGQILSLAEQKYIRRYGFMLIDLQNKSLKQHNEVTDHYNRIINGLNHDNRIQINRLKANRKIIETLKEQKENVLRCSASYCKMHDTYPADNEPCWQCVNTRVDLQVDDIKDCVQKQAKIRALETQLKVALVKNKLLANLQSELHVEKMARKGAFHELDRTTAELAKLRTQNLLQAMSISLYVNQLAALKIDLNIALEQRTADWQRIKGLEIQGAKYEKQIETLKGGVKNLNAAITILKCKIKDLHSVIDKLAKRIP